MWRKGLAEDGLLGWLQRARAEALDDAENNEQRQRAGHAAERGADDEDDERDQVDALLTEEARQKAGQRHDHDGGDDEPGRHPGDLLDGHAECTGEMRHSDVYD